MGEKIKYPWNMRICAFFKRNWRRLTEIGFRTKKIWRFIKLGWKDQDWDYAYMLYMEKAKLEDMARYYATCNIAETDWAVARDARICSRLIDIINGDNSSYTSRYKENGCTDGSDIIKLKKVNRKNMNRFNKDGRLPVYLLSKGDNNDMAWLFEDELRIEKAWNLYCKIRENNMRSWWN